MLLADNYEISVQDNQDMVLPGTSIVNCSLKIKLHVTLVATWQGMHVKRNVGTGQSSVIRWYDSTIDTTENLLYTRCTQ